MSLDFDLTFKIKEEEVRKILPEQFTEEQVSVFISGIRDRLALLIEQETWDFIKTCAFAAHKLNGEIENDS